MTPEDFEKILKAAPTERKPSAKMRRALYRMGRSRSWVKRYLADDFTSASAAIDTAIKEMQELKRKA